MIINQFSKIIPVLLALALLIPLPGAGQEKDTRTGKASIIVLKFEISGEKDLLRIGEERGSDTETYSGNRVHELFLNELKKTSGAEIIHHDFTDHHRQILSSDHPDEEISIRKEPGGKQPGNELIIIGSGNFFIRDIGEWIQTFPGRDEIQFYRVSRLADVTLSCRVFDVENTVWHDSAMVTLKNYNLSYTAEPVSTDYSDGGDEVSAIQKLGGWRSIVDRQMKIACQDLIGQLSIPIERTKSK